MTRVAQDKGAPIELTGWERERYGDAEAIARKLRMLAETLRRHARLIREGGHA
jgi:hypothetical protein